MQIIVIIVGLFAYNNYVDQGKIQFYEKQMEFYINASTVTSILATEDSITSPEYLKARKEFNHLYWGKLSIVETKEVERSMILFGHLLDCYEKQQICNDCLADMKTLAEAKYISSESMHDAKVSQSVLMKASLYLAHEARAHILNYWLSWSERKDYNRVPK